ncbi:(2Fe-2S)-binding protein [Azorhizobium sp. AG788]|uniref:(2Fe-2S)-binding protein n=1 Tax=Azorhizobium sp. AG788 TaxID=2183897 RepID=UPI0031392C0A
MAATQTSGGTDPRPMVSITIDGTPLAVREGDMLATILARADLKRLRHSPRAGAPRGAFCYMGVCQECALHVDGTIRQACLTPARAGMRVERRGVL